ncbi:hypothetical protein [Burkholderia ubonensis]|uniref:hypothetical protein n=1 Tax=Burkholderia ubonensis TaxID=101571 RepID=UPI0007C87248|nr:hypothetical protein [Burkholderia ubonensis]
MEFRTKPPDCTDDYPDEEAAGQRCDLQVERPPTRRSVAPPPLDVAAEQASTEGANARDAFVLLFAYATRAAPRRAEFAAATTGA